MVMGSNPTSGSVLNTESASDSLSLSLQHSLSLSLSQLKYFFKREERLGGSAG